MVLANLQVPSPIGLSWGENKVKKQQLVEPNLSKCFTIKMDYKNTGIPIGISRVQGDFSFVLLRRRQLQHIGILTRWLQLRRERDECVWGVETLKMRKDEIPWVPLETGNKRESIDQIKNADGHSCVQVPVGSGSRVEWQGHQEILFGILLVCNWYKDKVHRLENDGREGDF